MSHSPPGPLIGSGRNADVYDIGGGRVLRRYRDGRGQDSVAAEAAVMEHARAHGVPVPEVVQVRESEIVMERAVGPTMLEVLSRRPWTVRRLARQLADLHVLVHAVPALDRLPAPFDGLRGEGGLGGEGGQGGGEVLLHRDLHPHNVIMTAVGPRIIDWEGAARGPAFADVAMTWVIVAFSEPPGSRLQVLAVRPLQALFAREFLRAAGRRAAGRRAPVDRRVMAAAVRQRLKDSNLLPSEKARLERLQRSGRIPGR